MATCTFSYCIFWVGMYHYTYIVQIMITHVSETCWWPRVWCGGVWCGGVAHISELVDGHECDVAWHISQRLVDGHECDVGTWHIPQSCDVGVWHIVLSLLAAVMMCTRAWNISQNFQIIYIIIYMYIYSKLDIFTMIFLGKWPMRWPVRYLMISQSVISWLYWACSLPE